MNYWRNKQFQDITCDLLARKRKVQEGLINIATEKFFVRNRIFFLINMHFNILLLCNKTKVIPTEEFRDLQGVIDRYKRSEKSQKLLCKRSSWSVNFIVVATKLGYTLHVLARLVLSPPKLPRNCISFCRSSPFWHAHFSSLFLFRSVRNFNYFHIMILFGI